MSAKRRRRTFLLCTSSSLWCMDAIKAGAAAVDVAASDDDVGIFFLMIRKKDSLFLCFFLLSSIPFCVLLCLSVSSFSSFLFSYLCWCSSIWWWCRVFREGVLSREGTLVSVISLIQPRFDFTNSGVGLNDSGDAAVTDFPSPCDPDLFVLGKLY